MKFYGPLHKSRRSRKPVVVFSIVVLMATAMLYASLGLEFLH